MLAAEALWSWSRVHGASLSGVLVPDAIPVVEKVAADCIRIGSEGVAAFYDALPLRDGFLSVNITGTEPWATVMRENSAGAAPVGAPVFIAQGTIDDVVRPGITALYAGGVCALGTAVRYLLVPGESHFFIAFRSSDEAVAWMADRFAGKPAPDDCVRGAR